MDSTCRQPKIGNICKESKTKEESVAQQIHKVVVSFLLDETGSMSSVRDKTISGFNKYLNILNANKLPTILRLMTFNTKRFSVPYDWEDIRSVTDLTRQSYHPEAMTNLYDAIGKLIHETEGYIEHLSPTPEVICTIMTDGLENSSTEYTGRAVSKLISEKEKEGWTFVYLAANQDAWAEGGAMGIDRWSSANYESDAPDEALEAVAQATSRYMIRRIREKKVEKFFLKEDIVKIKGRK